MTINYTLAHVADGVPYIRDYGVEWIDAYHAYYGVVGAASFAGIAFLVETDDDGSYIATASFIPDCTIAEAAAIFAR